MDRNFVNRKTFTKSLLHCENQFVAFHMKVTTGRSNMWAGYAYFRLLKCISLRTICAETTEMKLTHRWATRGF